MGMQDMRFLIENYSLTHTLDYFRELYMIAFKLELHRIIKC